MYEKIGISLSRNSDYEVHIAGYAIKAQAHVNITFHPIFSFHRLSIHRILAPWKFYKLLLKVKPDYIIATTHEILVVTILHKILFGSKIIYDVQENYFRNIVYTSTFPWGIRHTLAACIRLKEKLSRPFIDHFILAEKNYEKEFSFTKGKSTVIENKAIAPVSLAGKNEKPKNKIRLLYSGTIAENYGVFEAVDLTIQLHKLDPRIELAIIGYSAKNETFEKLKAQIIPYKFIQLKGGNQLVPHQEILKEISTSHFGLVCYRPNKSTINCIPTKLYEYLAYHLPMIVQNNPAWEEIIKRYQAGIMIDYSNPDLQFILDSCLNTPFYLSQVGHEIYWEQEEKKLTAILKSLS
jgi:hypothetical protein